MERLTGADFEGQVLKSGGTVAVAFVADWCGFCRRFLRLWEPFEKQAPVPLAVADVTSYSSALWDVFDIDVVPTLVLFRDGAPAWRRDGVLMSGLGPDDLVEMKEAAETAA